MNVKLRESTYILKETEEIYEIVFTSTRRIKRFRVDSLAKDAINSAKYIKDYESLVSELSQNYLRSNVVSCLNSLLDHGILVRETEQLFNQRYVKQRAFIEELATSSEEADALQEKLEHSKIAVFGVGGIGTWIVNGLHQIGIGEMRIIDPDVVEASNLNRQLYFSTADIGQYKTDVLKKKMPDATIIPFKKLVAPGEDLEEILTGVDFVVNCCDSPSVQETTQVIDKYARKMHIPYLVTGGYNLHLGMIGPIIVPGKTACFDCFMEHQRRNDPLSKMEKIKDIEQTGNIGPIAGIVSNLQVMDIFKFLIQKGSVNFNRFAEIDFMDLSIEWREFSKMEDCNICNTKNETNSIG